MKLDRAYGVYIHFRDLDKWRKKREIADHYADVHIEIDGKVLEMTFEEFRDRVFARPEVGRNEWNEAMEEAAAQVSCRHIGQETRYVGSESTRYYYSEKLEEMIRGLKVREP